MILHSTIFLTIGLVVAFFASDLHPLSDEYINKINNKQSLWTAGRNFKIEEHELFKIKASGGIRRTTPKIYAKVHDENENVPESFDSRVEWPECSTIISIIRDQSKCGACWGCQSYFLPPCEDHLNKCTDYGDSPSCSNVCDVLTLDYQKQKTYGSELVELSGEQQIQLEIMKNGPGVGIFDIYPDLASYKNGIYQATSQDPRDYITSHAIEIFGWGVENGVKYWQIVNSWGPNWGENGFFRILRGVNEVTVESEVTAALPDFSRF